MKEKIKKEESNLHFIYFTRFFFYNNATIYSRVDDMRVHV
jgi:hypothetical protein